MMTQNVLKLYTILWHLTPYSWTFTSFLHGATVGNYFSMNRSVSIRSSPKAPASMKYINGEPALLHDHLFGHQQGQLTTNKRSVR